MSALLPPLVNSGCELTLGMAVNMKYIESTVPHMDNSKFLSLSPALTLTIGLVSFVLFLTNALCLYVGGLFIFTLKRIQPQRIHVSSTFSFFVC